MACQINWTFQAWRTYSANIKRFETEWTKAQVARFVHLVETKIETIAQQPLTGTPQDDTKNINIRHTLVHKRIGLIYKYKPLTNEIDILTFWNNWQHPLRVWKMVR